jgi:hypothetical protein
MEDGAAFLGDLRRLVADEGFAIAIFAAVAAAAIIGFGFDATSDVVASVLILGIATAFAETKLRARK